MHFSEGPNSLTGEASRDKPTDQQIESSEGNFNGFLVHLDNKLPGNIELSNFA